MARESVLWISTFPHMRDRLLSQRCGDMGPWATPGGLLFAFPGDRSGSPRSMSFASVGWRHLSDESSEWSKRRPRSPHRLVGVARLGAAAYAAANLLPSKVDPSRQIAYRMRLKRRAKATTAIRRPRRPASRSAQARRVALPPGAPTDPRGLHQERAQLAGPRLGDVTAVAPLRGTVFPRTKPIAALTWPGSGASEALVPIDKAAKRRRRQSARPRAHFAAASPRHRSTPGRARGHRSRESHSSTSRPCHTTAPVWRRARPAGAAGRPALARSHSCRWGAGSPIAAEAPAGDSPPETASAPATADSS